MSERRRHIRLVKAFMTCLVAAYAASTHAYQQPRDQPSARLTAEQIRSFYDHYFGGDHPGAAYAAVLDGTGDVEIQMNEVHATRVYDARPTEERVRSLVCRRPLTAIGTFSGQEGHLTADNAWIYTEGTFTISEVVRSTATGVVPSPGAQLSYVTSGGSVMLKGRRVLARPQKDAREFAPGHRYLVVFETYLSQTGAFENAAWSWDVSGQVPVPTVPSLVGDLTPKETQQLLDWARSAPATPSDRGGCRPGTPSL